MTVQRASRQIDTSNVLRARVRLGANPRRCPRCASMLFRDDLDLSCWLCGWRESCYFVTDGENNPASA